MGYCKQLGTLFYLMKYAKVAYGGVMCYQEVFFAVLVHWKMWQEKCRYNSLVHHYLSNIETSHGDHWKSPACCLYSCTFRFSFANPLGDIRYTVVVSYCYEIAEADNALWLFFATRPFKLGQANPTKSQVGGKRLLLQGSMHIRCWKEIRHEMLLFCDIALDLLENFWPSP